MLEFLRRNQIAIFAAAVVLMGAFIVARSLTDRSPRGIEFRDEGLPPSGRPIIVHIDGAVANPGVYELRDGDRLADAIDAAGGPTEEADSEELNLARRVRDEERIVIPERAGALPLSGFAALSGPININTASADLLDTLPGIGEAYSRRIVDSRTVDGPYKATEDLISRRVLPRATFDGIASLITVGP
jgi:competence protein ComEA